MKPVSTDDIFDLMDAFVTSAALNTALELGLFWLLVEKPLDTTAIAQALDLPTNRCHYWLQLLCNKGLLDLDSTVYATSPTAHTAILEAFSQDTWAFLAAQTRGRYPAILDLAQYIQEPRSTWEIHGLSPPDYFQQLSQSPDQARRFTRMLYEIHLPLAEAVANDLDLSGAMRLMDLGGGSGVISMALLRRNPQLTAVVVDIANVCAAGREIAAENSLGDRITYLARDFIQDELPSEFDLVLQCDVGPFSTAIFNKIWTVLNPGGRLVIVDQFAPATGVAPSAWLYWAFLASLVNPAFTLSTISEVQSRLEEAGFQLLSTSSLAPSTVRRWSSDWILLEAGK